MRTVAITGVNRVLRVGILGGGSTGGVCNGGRQTNGRRMETSTEVTPVPCEQPMRSEAARTRLPGVVVVDYGDRDSPFPAGQSRLLCEPAVAHPMLRPNRHGFVPGTNIAAGRQGRHPQETY